MPGSRTDGSADESFRTPRRLGEAVSAGRRALEDLRCPDGAVSSGELGKAMRTALAHHRQRATTGVATHDAEGDTVDLRRWERAAVSVQIACAHLDAGNLTEARLALDTAYDALPHHDRNAPAGDADRGRTGRRARAASQAQQQGLSDHTLVGQAVGVLVEHGQVGPSQAREALRRHARHHRLVVADLAADIVAGRVSPHEVVAFSIERKAG